jgi:hypothetical protein
MAALSSGGASSGQITQSGSDQQKRKRSQGQVEASIAGGMEGQHERDTSFIKKFLEPTERHRLAAYVAGLLRDGILERAMTKAESANAPQALGKKLPKKIRRLKAFPPSFKLKWTMDHADGLFVDKPAGADLTIDDFQIPLTLVDKLCEYLLCYDADNLDVPTDFIGADFEKPMVAQWDARAKVRGKTLNGLTRDNMLAGKFGFFKWDKASPLDVGCDDGSKFKLTFDPKFIAEMTDLCLVDNHSCRARIESIGTGFEFNLHKARATIVKKQSEVEMKKWVLDPGQVDRYKNLVPALVVAAPKAKGKPKAAATVKKERKLTVKRPAPRSASSVVAPPR